MKFLPIFIFLSLMPLLGVAQKPNIILIMADDMGYETVGANGGQSYKTPHLDRMASEGMRFTNCFANPLCTPSRVKIMTGQYNTRNYVQFRVLDRGQRTFAHYLRDAGYRTVIAGKWQLGKEEDSAQHFGFEESLLWQHVRGARREGTKIDSRHVNPRLERNGKAVDYDNGEFSSDVFVEFLGEFMTQHKDEPIFAYYPMVLPHCPFVPTPGTADFDAQSMGSKTYKGKVQYFGAMVGHIDKMVARLEAKLEELGIADNTMIVFTGDNGTDIPVKSQWSGRQIAAGKGKMTDEGMRVPLIIKFPGKVEAGKVSDALVDLADFLPTFTELAGVEHEAEIDGVSLLPELYGKGGRVKPYAYIWYEPKKGETAKATVMARSKTHMLMRKGEDGELVFYQTPKAYEKVVVPMSEMGEADRTRLKKLESVLERYDALRGSSLRAQ
ncbi:sulfatase-like hydrolase/transferase [Rubritalea tangerina]|uniref:Sulfatase-like hydrolase/transferase n=1 Tax=Rubritalea tangerina TaxID=430798 RepID=A0ABW4Z8Y7_9BACT